MKNGNIAIGKVLKTFIILHICLFSCRSVAVEVGTVSIENPYEGVDFDSAVRVVSTTHEHVTSQGALEDYVNRGIDVLCISNYSPAIPVMPITGFSREYIDWQIEEDVEGHILYEKDENGKIRTFTINDYEYKIPVLRKVKKNYSGGFKDFYDKNGFLINLSEMPQLPNAEHTHYYWPNEAGLSSTKHFNVIGSRWADVCNGVDEIDGLIKYNKDNDYKFNSIEIRSLFPLWCITEMLDSIRNNLVFPNKVFGTINHPGYSEMTDRYLDGYMKYGGDVFKAIEVYNNSDYDSIQAYNISFYDQSLLRGYHMWCTAANDWGNLRTDKSHNPRERGCNVLYVDKCYNDKITGQKEELVLDAYISGSFSAAGYGFIYLTDVSVKGSSITVSFSSMPDRTIVDIDGVRTEGGKVSSLSIEVNSSNRFVRFEAYKDDDFVFTNPFFVRVD